MPVELRSEELATLFESARNEELLLPNFQRDFVWSMEEQKGLATSLILDIPCGSLLFLSGTTADFSSRALGSKSRIQPNDPHPCEFVLDGQQRLSSLFYLIDDPLEGCIASIMEAHE